MSKETQSFYNTIAWQNCREAYMKKVGGLCELCLKQGIYKPAELIHHKIEITTKNMDDPGITLNFNNLMALCREHHAEVHAETYMRRFANQSRRYYFDENGRCIIINN